MFRYDNVCIDGQYGDIVMMSVSYLVLVAPCSVQAEALAGLRATRTPPALLGRCFADRSNDQRLHTSSVEDI